jgi:hypothetical protein
VERGYPKAPGAEEAQKAAEAAAEQPTEAPQQAPTQPAAPAEGAQP